MTGVPQNYHDPIRSGTPLDACEGYRRARGARFIRAEGVLVRQSTKKWIRRAGVALFILYVLLLIYFLFFSEEYGRVAEFDRAYQYNLIPFVEIRRFWVYREQLGTFAVFTNLVGNVVGFVPYGLLLPVIFRNFRSGGRIVLSGFALSLTVEIIQLITKVGSFDVDDLMLNTLGAFLGYLIFAVCDKIRRNYDGKKV